MPRHVWGRVGPLMYISFVGQWKRSRAKLKVRDLNVFADDGYFEREVVRIASPWSVSVVTNAILSLKSKDVLLHIVKTAKFSLIS